MLARQQERGTGLVPLERVAEPKRDISDKATRKMITRIESTLGKYFPLEIQPMSLELKGNRYVPVSLRGQENLFQRIMVSRTGEYQLDPRLPIEIISGMCMFGASGLMAVTESGQVVSITDPLQLKTLEEEKIVQVIEQPELHVSELESILRITEMLTRLQESQRLAGINSTMTCSFHVPIPEYKLYVLDLVERGMLTRKQATELFVQLENRGMNLAKIVEKRAPKGIQLNFGSPLQNIESVLDPSKGTSFNQVFDLLSRNPYFADQLDQLRGTPEEPTTFQDLAKLSYVAGYFQVSDSAQENGANCLAVEIAEEKPILENACSLAKGSGRSIEMAAIYIASDTLSLNGRNNRLELFMHEPLEDETPLSGLRAVFKNKRKDLR